MARGIYATAPVEPPGGCLGRNYATAPVGASALGHDRYWDPFGLFPRAHGHAPPVAPPMDDPPCTPYNLPDGSPVLDADGSTACLEEMQGDEGTPQYEWDAAAASHAARAAARAASAAPSAPSAHAASASGPAGSKSPAARTAAAPFGEKDHGQPETMRQLVHSVLLVVAFAALSACQHGVVV